MRWILPFCLLGIFIGPGCSSRKEEAGRKTAMQEMDMANGNVVIQKPGAGPADAKNAPEKAPAEKPRKIKYTADLHLIVEDFDKAVKDLKIAMKENKAHEAKSEINGSANTVRNGVWYVRVPVDQFDNFRDAVRKLGEVEKDIVDSEDLTDRYYDLEAHIKNRNAERDAIRDLLQEVGKKDLKHYIEVKRELDSISDDINRKEGQLRLWANLTDLTTCTVKLREKQKYIAAKPPETAETPTFGMRAGRIWTESWDGVLGFCQAIALIAVALTPWLPVIAALVGGVWLAVRRRWRASTAPVIAVAEGPAENDKK